VGLSCTEQTIVSEHAAVLFANEAFYVAFAGRDVAAMEMLWSRRRPVTCIHPGWLPLDGREAVMQSWEAILDNPASPAIACVNATAHLLDDIAYVLCQERLEHGFLVATNIFVREADGWKMVHHQAGASPPPPEMPPAPPLQ
jgi:ketosteroid isomerase-like protein